MSSTAPDETKLRLITFGTMLATFIQVLDTTIANVALPHMQGSFAASQDQIIWVLTSYIVAAAIMTPATGWLSNRFGRKRLFLASVAGFTVASVLCGIAGTLTEIVVYRVMQGICGAALVPLSQSTLLDNYPRERHGSAMAIWGIGTVVGPVLGPTLGGWLTDHYSWRWVFYINIPFGVLAFLVISSAVPESKSDSKLRFDVFGFIAISVAIASLQLFLDRGELKDWFGSTEIIVELVMAVLFFYLFVVHSFTTEQPFISPKLFTDRNYSISLIFMGSVGLVLYATMALLPPFLQGLLNIPVLTVGLILAPRGIGTMVSMFLVGRLVGRIDPRFLLVFGLSLTAYSLEWMVGFSLDVPIWQIVASGTLQGFGLGFVFVPLSTIAFSTLPTTLRNEAAAVFSLLRNIGASAGIAGVTVLLTQNMQILHAELATHVTSFNRLFQAPTVQQFWNVDSAKGLAAINAEVTRQAAMIAYINDFKLMMIITILLIPLVLLMSSPRRHKPNADVPAASVAVD